MLCNAPPRRLTAAESTLNSHGCRGQARVILSSLIMRVITISAGSPRCWLHFRHEGRCDRADGRQPRQRATRVHSCTARRGEQCVVGVPYLASGGSRHCLPVHATACATGGAAARAQTTRSACAVLGLVQIPTDYVTLTLTLSLSSSRTSTFSCVAPRSFSKGTWLGLGLSYGYG